MSNTLAYSVERISNCLVVRGPIPIADFAALMKTMPSDSVLSTTLSKRYCATFVSGRPDDLKALLKIAPLAPLPPDAAGLPLSAQAWLQQGERGSSSEAMFDAAFGRHMAARRAGATCAPSDPSDLARCRRLVESVGEVREEFAAIARLSPVWQRIITDWDTLCATMDEEAPDWRSGTGSAERTYALLRHFNDQHESK